MLRDEDRDLMRAVREYLQNVNNLSRTEQAVERTPLGDLISEHLGADARELPVVLETIADHRLVDADIALERIGAEAGGRIVGVGGGDQRHHVGMADLISSPHFRFAPGPVDYAERATGPATSRRVVAMGVRLLTQDGQPIAVVQRAADPQFGRQTATLEVMGAEPATVSVLLERVRELMIEHSVLRGQVLSFVPTEYGRDAGATFLRRPEVAASEVILPDGLLDEIAQHAVGIGEHRELLRAAGQHLKRGVLLYGPPGTGKTLTIRHLLARTPDVTAVLLTGASIRFIGMAAEIARTFQPSIVVLEDIDLVAMERHASPQPLLFEVLEALDGLGGDADVAFVMTTNRVEVLEGALAQRPGRVDLAAEVPLPSLRERERLYRYYAQALPFTDEVLRAAAASTEGVTASFAKELIRRSVLLAAVRGEEVADTHLTAALDELTSERQRLTRSLLGAGPQDQHGVAATQPGPTGGTGWVAMTHGGAVFRPGS